MTSLVRSKWTAFAISSAFLAWNAPAGAAIANIPAMKDNSIMEDAFDGSCANGNLYSGETRSALSRRALIAFDVAAEIPAGSTINGAVLRLKINKAGPDAAGTDIYRLYRLTASWGESIGAGASECFGGSGATAVAGDATWSHRFWPSTPWATVGGNYNPTPSAAAATPIAGFAVWSSQPEMVATVQSWLDSPGGNFGWVIIGEEDIPTTAREFSSREGVSPPELVIDYTEPAATTPPEVPDGRLAPPLRVNKLSANGSDLEVSWDTAHCTVNPDHNIVYGTRSTFPSSIDGPYGLQGVVCSAGGASPFTWLDSPNPAVLDPGSKLLWLVVIANDGTTLEGSWGLRTPMLERTGPGTGGSCNACGIQNKAVSNRCGQDF